MNRNLLSLSLLPALLASLTCQGSASGQDKVDLKIAAKKGDACAFVSKQTQAQSIDVGGQQMEMGSQFTNDMVLKVTDVAADGTLSVEVNIKRIRGSIENPMMGTTEFDTAPPKDGKKDEDEDDGMGMGLSPGALRKSLGELCGKSFSAKVAGNGKVLEIGGIDEALKAARNKAGGGAMMLGGVLNEGTIKQLVGAAFGPLPKEPVAVGGGWEADPVDAKGGSVATTRQMTLKLTKADAESAEISVSGTISAPKADGKKKDDGKKDDETEEAAQARQMMADAKIENGKISGTVSVSRKDGFVVRSETKMTMDITAPSPMGGGDMKIGVTTTTIVERAKPEAEAKGGEAKPATTGGGK